MKKTPSSIHPPHLKRISSFATLAGLTALFATSCTKEDEALQRQMAELRSSLSAKSEALEKIQSQSADLQGRLQQLEQNSSTSRPSQDPPAKDTASLAALNKAQARIRELEQALETARRTTPPPTEAASNTKLDLDVMRDKLQEDLTRKARQLGETVQRQSSGSRIEEMSLKGIEYPPEVISPFRSSITLVVASGGQKLKLVFPVTADLSGRWSLPGPDEIQKYYRQALDHPIVLHLPETFYLKGFLLELMPGR